ncbi:MAG: hypothetical protein E6H58_20585 [Betaproteobacteria bacterium]|nr:MAG: hypothetical protein E6H58_20585 [Betaproteobacteria bacterium]
MTIFRWIIGIFTLLLAAGGLLAFVIFVLSGTEEWLDLARRFRRWVFAAVLFWFNIEIWGSILRTLIHW